MTVSLLVLSLPITIIGANFDEEYRLLKKAKQDEIERKRQARKESATPATKLGDSAVSQQGGMSAVVKGLSPVSKVCTHERSCVPCKRAIGPV